ncbi:LysR family transcriptional regulator [Shewanella eurypsychrophilus]|uniref:LysR family transcriptional regulator n=1 Tax=Shewanella eurypsychrophilus TaxID=2593656 RepID=A0ABX6V3K2_9GAMM|nr:MULTISPECIES: LysR family transcriptional regulator [Shewanella]QFU20552.1 LysR family transcriptional regulator [Shewanella sp. YLB-09]QFU20833.1 LysR family transcriptional regulator [Shewanella sp. YLB-09]QPG56121.1 LysR family transcriptional regulator [Shewanella eurypsychrophilus]
MDSGQLYRMLVFANVVEHGSLTAAANELGISRSMVSQHLKKLELRCETQLIQRTTRKMALTEDGQNFYYYCAELLQLAKQAEQATQPNNKELYGSIKILAPVCFGEHNLIKHIGDFHKCYPKIRISIRLEDRHIDLIENNIDIAIHADSYIEPNINAIALSKFDEYLVASPEYIEQNGSPLHPDMLQTHQWILQSSNLLPKSHQIQNSYGDKFKLNINPFITCNSNLAVMSLAKQGIGVGILPSYLALAQIEQGHLVQVLSDYHLQEGLVYATHSFNDVLPPRVKAFLNYIEERLKLSI